MTLRIFISAGEASGEHYGALLAQAIHRRLAATGEPAALFGMGGARMAAAGLDVVVPSEEMAVMGLTEVVRHLPRIYREFRKLKQAIRARRPDVAVLIDFPEIHFRLAKELHRLGVPVVYFVSPQLWAWKQHRIEMVRKYVGKMLVIFPFEEVFYRQRGVDAEFVGHPLAELAPPSVSREEFARQHRLDPACAWIGLLPGSRAREIADLLPEMLKAARLYRQECAQRPRPQFVLPLAPTLTAAQRARVRSLVTAESPRLPVRLVDDARAALFHARAAIVASGTATVEAALIGNPFLVVYRVSPITYAIAKRIVNVPHVAMANLIAGRRVVPELIQQEFTASNILCELRRLLPEGEARQSMMQNLKQVREALQTRPQDAPKATGAIDRVAAVVLELAAAALPARTHEPVPR